MHYLAYCILGFAVQCHNKKFQTPNQNALICFIFEEIIHFVDFKSQIIIFGA